MELIHKTTFQELVAENFIQAVGLMDGHLNSDQENGIILMMPGLPASRLEARVGHCNRLKTAISFMLAQLSAQLGEPVDRISFMEHGCPLLIQHQHIAETQIPEDASITGFTMRFRYLS